MQHVLTEDANSERRRENDSMETRHRSDLAGT